MGIDARFYAQKQTRDRLSAGGSLLAPLWMLLVAVLVIWGGFASSLQALTLDQEKASYATITSDTITLTGHSELTITGTGDPIPGCTVNLNSEDSWVFFKSVSPSSVVSTLLSRFKVNGATAVVDSNVRVVQYLSGAVVIPQASDYRPLQVFTGTQMTGTSTRLGCYTAYNNATLGVFADKIRSFILKRGYTATFAADQNGVTSSRNFVAQDGDLEVSFMPSGLDATVSFVRVFPWRWTGKKGVCDSDPVGLKANWHYNWNIDKTSTRDWEYVGIRAQRYWPSLDQDWKYRGVNQLSGYNEPDSTAQANIAVGDAIYSWPDLLGTGLRVGAPAVTDGGYSWITSFITQANSAGLRVDYVPVHYYRSYTSASDPSGATTQLYNYLKSIYDATGKPIWVTEFNNGANWTTGPDPTVDQNKATIEAMINMMDSTPWIERYSVYSKVEWFRQTNYDDGSITPMGAMYRDHVAPMAYQQTVPNTGSSGNASYFFENQTRDTQSGNNAVVYGTPKYVPGKSGNALSFDGTDDYLSLAGRLGDSTDFSFAGWVKWNGGANWQRIFDLGNGQSNYLFLSPKSGGGTLRFAIKYNNGTEQQLNSTALTAGVWTHVAVTISGDTGKLFVNGALVNTNTAMTYNPSQIGTETNYIGKSQFADPLYTGLLDEIRFFNYALTDAQVTALAGSTAPVFVSSPSVGSATLGRPFSASLVPLLSTSSTGVTFTKSSGPAWVSVAADGTLSGVPTLADMGASTLLVRASAAGGAAADLSLPLQVISPALVERFAFDGNANAAAGPVNGTAAGGPVYVTGQRGQAIDLDGVDDHVVLPAGVANTDEITVATWVQWDGGSSWQRLFDFGNGSNSYLFLTPQSGTSTLRFAIKDGGSEQIVETTALTVGAWTHVAVTLGSGSAKLYVNGVNVASNNAVTIQPSAIKPILNYIGRSQFAADPYFNGRVDDFHIFCRVLTGAEINTLYTGTAPVITLSPRQLSTATLGANYEDSIIGAATASSGTVTYEKVAGPDWLTIEPDGRVSGVPSDTDAGTPYFRVRASTTGVTAADFLLTVPVTAPSGTRALLELDGNANDYAGTNHAIAYGSPVYTAGWYDQAIDLDGVDDYLQMPTGITSDLGDFTIISRFRWDGGAAWQRLFDFGNNTSQYFFLTPYSGTGTMRFSITLGGNATQQYIETSPAPVGEWTQVAMVLSGTTGTLYVNGVAATTGTITLKPSQIAATLPYIGKSQWPDPYFNGAIDDFRIIPRALSAAEVKSLAAPPAPTLITRGYSWWTRSYAFTSGQADLESDPDGDGRANVIEWLTGSQPLQAGGAGDITQRQLSAATLGLTGSKNYLTLTARLRKLRPGVTIIPEAADSPAALGTPAAASNVSQAGAPLDDGDFEIFTWYRKVPIEDAPTGFMRLRVVPQN
jgi:Concanavalin A-like lectin/glucanases superfamily/Glycosyl hydrolase catalytic core/Putative Ig domain